MRGFVALYAAATCAWLPLARRTLPLRVVMIVALALRALLLLPDARLSGDVYRYLSDGAALRNGVNPYVYTPTDPRISYREIRSIYPPHAQFLFALTPSLVTWRLLIIACELAALLLLRERALAYATCPLVLFEGTWSAHLDAVAAVLLLAAWSRRSGALLGIAGGLKLIPLASAPALLRARRARLASLAIAFALPFAFFLRGPIMPGLRDYARRWIFNSPAYELVFDAVRLVPTKAIWTHHPLRFAAISDVVYRHLDPDFMTRAILGTIAVACIATALRPTTGIAALLVCSPAIHPWYWLTLVPLALAERSAWLAFALAAPLSYLLYAGAPRLAVYAICYALPACVLPFASRSSSSP